MREHLLRTFIIFPQSVKSRGNRLAVSSSHAAIWAGMYVVGAMVCVAQVAGIDAIITPRARAAAALYAFCTATAVYILDRVKLRNAWLDPADAEAHPRRFAFVAGHAAILRTAMAVLLAIAAALGGWLLAWGEFLPFLSVAGVLLYAGRPRSKHPRVKDVVLLKNAYVALGITGFAALVAVAAIRPGSGVVGLWTLAVAHAWPLAIASAHVAVRVLADAVLCDLDDEAADRRFGTATLPTELGRRWSMNAALLARLGASTILLFIPGIPLLPRVLWAVITAISSLSLRWTAPARVRDWVDARFAMEAAAVALILALVRYY
jgi:hypothetical protein